MRFPRATRQKRKSSVGLGMSAFGGEADVISAKADIAARRSVSYAKMPVMTPNAKTPNVMLATPMKVYFMSKVAARATMTLVMACSIDTRSKAWPRPVRSPNY